MERDFPLKPICARWLDCIKKAEEYKKAFTQDAAEAMMFFSSDSDAVWGEIAKNKFAKGVGLPTFRMVVNRLWEAVRIFAAVIHHRNPNRVATPKQLPSILPQQLGIVDQPVPQMGPDGQPVVGPDGQMVMMPSPEMMEYHQMAGHQQMLMDHRTLVSSLLEMYLNYTPNELNLQYQSRQVVEEAFIKGAGVWWHELYAPPGSSTRMVGSFFDTIDNLVWDPDADKFDDIRWAARKRIRPIDDVASEFGLDREWLKGHAESYSSQADSKRPDYKYRKSRGQTNDLLEYWEIYSKTGFGDRLKDVDERFRGAFDSLGQNCYIVVAKGIDFPLNIHPDLLKQEVGEGQVPDDLFMAAQWPVPFWVEPNGWPFTPLMWHGKPNYTWPLTVVSAGMGELRFINWAMSYLMGRIQKTADTIIGVAKGAEESLKAQITAPSEGGLKVVEISQALNMPLNQLIQVFEQPQVSQEMFRIIAEVTAMFDRRVGLTELIYGMTSASMRSATESQVKMDQVSIRPDDYANILETAMSECARKEALMARWALEPQDVEPILGPLGARAWAMHVKSADVESVAREYSYRVEAGSTRKPNSATRLETINNAMQILMPVAQGLMQAGQPQLFNALMADWGKAMEIDVSKYVIPPPPPPPPEQAGPPPAEPPPPPEGQ